MKRIAKRLVTALCLVICAVMLISVPLAGCTDTGRDTVHNVHFEKGDIPDEKKDTVKNMPATQAVNDGECATEPSTVPTADGYTFRYWYDSGDETRSAFSFSTPVKSRLYLEAHWEATQYYTVTFSLGDAGSASTIPSQTVAGGGMAAKPEDPTASGYTFAGWYTDAGCTAAFSFSSAITSNITLYAKWTATSNTVYYTVTFDLGSAGAAAVAGQTVESGGKAARPSDPAASGYTFAGWYADSAFTASFDFSSAIYSDTTIYAKWTLDSTPEPDEPAAAISVKYSTGVLNYGMAANMPEDREAESGTVITEPKTVPSMPRYEFTGWYTKARGGREFDFSQAITQDTTIYAHWISTSSSVSVGAAGDSLTAPQSWSGYNPYSYYLQQNLDADAGGVYTVSNYGVSGATVTTLLDNTTSRSRQYIQGQNFYNVGSGLWTGGYNRSISDNPDIIIIMLGTNDAQYKSAAQCWDAVSSLAYKDDLEELIRSYQDNDSQVILVTSPHLFEENAEGTPLYTSDVREEDVLKANEVQREVADEMGLYLMDFHTYMESRADKGYSYVRHDSTESFSVSGYPGDGLHFSTAGTSALADYLTSAVEAVACREETALTGSEVDVVLFAGQSNMAGRGDVSGYSSVTAGAAEGHGYAYDMNTGTLGRITEPFGADQNGTKPGYMSETSKTGSMVSAFAESFYAETEVPVVAVSASRGGSPIAAWTKGGAYCTVSNAAGTYCNYYADTLERLEGAVQCVEDTDGMEIRNVFVVWLQGETDGDNGTDADSYKTQLAALYSNLSADLQADKGRSLDHLYMIPIGTYEGSGADIKGAYNTIRKAQTEFCADNDYADVISLGMQDLTASGTSKYLRNDGYYVHLTQPGYEILGRNAGANTGLYVDGGAVTLQRYDTDNDVWYTPSTATVKVDTAGGRIAAGEWENEQTIGSILSVPDNADNLSGQDLLGWYYTTDGATYTKVTASTYVQENMTLVPYFSSAHSNITANDAVDSAKAGYVNDGGISAGTTDNNYYLKFSAASSLNVSDYTEDMVITYTGTDALANLNWFRLNTYYDVAVSAGNSYNIYYRLTNCGSEAIAFTMYHCTNGWIWSSSAAYQPRQYVYAQAILEPGQSALVVFDSVELEYLANSNNFTTCFVIGLHDENRNTEGSYSITDFRLGVQTGIYESATVTLSGITEGAAVSEDYLGISGGAAYDAETGVLSADKGAIITLPAAEDLEIYAGYIFAGWYTDEEYTSEVSGAIEVTENTILYARWITQAAITLDLDGLSNISLAEEGSATYAGSIDASLNELLFSDGFKALYTLDSGYSVTGWYIKGDTDEAVTADMTLRGDITVYPAVASADASLYIAGTDGAAVTAPADGNALSVVAGSGLKNAITNALANGELAVSISRPNGEVTGWEYSLDYSADTAAGAAWYAVTDETVIADGMHIRPVVTYTTTITITFDPAIITKVECNDDSDDTGAFTIQVTEGTPYDDILADSVFFVTLDSHYASYAFHYGTGPDGAEIQSGDEAEGLSVSLYIAAAGKTYTLSYAGRDGYMSTANTDEDIIYGDPITISFASVAATYANESGYDLEGFFLETDGTLSTAAKYTAADTYNGTVSGDVTVYPVLTTPRSEGGTTDPDNPGNAATMGVAIHDGFVNGSNSNITKEAASGQYNTTVFRMETVVSTTLGTSTNSGNDNFGSYLGTYRIKAYTPSSSANSFVYAGRTYNVEWTVTNYGPDTVTMNLFMVSHGYAFSGNNLYDVLASKYSITLAPEEYCVFNAAITLDDDNAALFLLAEVTSEDGTDTALSLGIMCDYAEAATVTLELPSGITISGDWLARYHTALTVNEDTNASIYTIYRDIQTSNSSSVFGSGDITLPSAADLEGISDHAAVTWTSNGEEVTDIGAGAYAAMTAVDEYTVTVSLEEAGSGAGAAVSGSAALTLAAGTNLLEYLNRYAASNITYAEGYALSGWYFYNDSNEKVTIVDGYYVNADITVYPDIAETTASMHVISSGDVTITAPFSGFAAVSEGAYLASVIESYLADGTIAYTLDRTTGYTISWQYSTDCNGDNAETAEWHDVTGETAVSSGMYIRPVAAYTTSVALTYDSRIVTGVEYNDETDSSGTLVIVVAEGTPYNDFLSNVRVTLSTYFEGVAFYIGTDAAHGELIDLTSDGQAASGETVTVYVTTTTPLERTVTISPSVSTISLNSEITFNVLSDTAITLPAADGVTDSSAGKTLTGWYVEDGEGNAYGSADYGICDLGATVTVDISTGSLIIWPVYTDTSVYNIDINNNKNASYSVSDKAGVVLGRENGATGIIRSTYTYNKNDNVKEYTVTSTQALAEGYWFRFNTIASASGITLTRGVAYDFHYALTNYGTEEITVGLYHCSNGYMDSSTSASEYRDVILEPGQTAHLAIMDFLQPTTTSEDNFITVIQIESGTAENLALGARVGVSGFESGTTGMLYITEVNGISLDEGWASRSVEDGTQVTLPAEGNGFTVSEGYVFLGWYEVDENGNERYLGMSHTFTFTYETITFKPYVITAAEATRTVSLAENVEGVSAGSVSYVIGTDETVALPSAADTAVAIEGRTLTGWYVEDEGGSIYGPAADGIYDPGAEIAVDAAAGNLTIWPVLSDSFYNLTVNSGISGSTVLADYSGHEAAFGTNVSTFNSSLAPGTAYNRKDYASEFTVVATGHTLASGDWFRMNTLVSGVLGGNTSANARYNIYYAVTNYSSETLAINLYHCTNGYWSNSTGRDVKSVTLAPGATGYITFYAFDVLRGTGSNFLTLIQLYTEDGAGITDFVLGLRARIETYPDSTAASTEAAVSLDLTDADGFTVSDSWTSSGHAIGSSLAVPAAGDCTDTLDGRTLSGWYCYDENGSPVCVSVDSGNNPVYLISAGGTFTITSSAVTLVPAFAD